MDRVFAATRFPAPQANFFKEYSRYTFKKVAPSQKRRGLIELVVRWIIMLMRDHWCATLLNNMMTRRWLILSGVYQGCRKAPNEYGGVMSLEQHIIEAAEDVVGYCVQQQHKQRQALNFLYADDCTKVLWDIRTCVDTALDLFPVQFSEKAHRTHRRIERSIFCVLG